MTTTDILVNPSEAATRTSAASTIDACKVYGAEDNVVVAVDQVTVAFETGRFSAIMGPSGSGKSTLMHCMAGLDPLTSGQAFIGDVDLTKLHDKQLTKLRRDKIGFVFQSYNLIPSLSALENITLPDLLAGRKPDQEWLDRVVQTVGLADRLSHRPSELSGGQQQRVAVENPLEAWRKVGDSTYPRGGDQMMIDAGTARKGKFRLGDKVTVISQGGKRVFTLVGTVRFGNADAPGGSTFALFDVPTAQSFVGKPGEIDAVQVAAKANVNSAARRTSMSNPSRSTSSST